MLQHLEQQWGQAYTHPAVQTRPLLAPPRCHRGGPHGALVPFFSAEYCRIEYSILYPPDVGAGPIMEEVERFVADACRLDPWLQRTASGIRWNLDWEPSSLPVDHELTTAVARARRAATGDAAWSGDGPDPLVRGFDAVCDATYLRKAGIPSVVCGPGSIQFAHAVDESVAIADVIDAARVYALAPRLVRRGMSGPYTWSRGKHPEAGSDWAGASPDRKPRSRSQSPAAESSSQVAQP